MSMHAELIPAATVEQPPDTVRVWSTEGHGTWTLTVPEVKQLYAALGAVLGVGEWREVTAPGAFAKTVGDGKDVPLTVNFGDTVGTAHVTQDEDGLRVTLNARSKDQEAKWRAVFAALDHVLEDLDGLWPEPVQHPPVKGYSRERGRRPVSGK
jgi:hypothetical protein